MTSVKHPQVMVIVRFKSSLPAEEVQRRYEERMPEFRALPGLLQKYYIHNPSSGEWGGVYLWDSQASLDAYLASDLRKSIPETYQIVGEPRVDVIDVVEPLRPERA